MAESPQGDAEPLHGYNAVTEPQETQTQTKRKPTCFVLYIQNTPKNANLKQ